MNYPLLSFWLDEENPDQGYLGFESDVKIKTDTYLAYNFLSTYSSIIHGHVVSIYSKNDKLHRVSVYPTSVPISTNELIYNYGLPRGSL